MPVIKWTQVESSQIRAVSHSKETLYVQFHNGAEWSYKPVSDKDYKLFMSSESLGKFFNAHVKNNKGITAQKV